MRCPQSRPATISCRQTMAMSKPSGGVAVGIGAAGIGAAGGGGERIRLNVPIIDAHDQRSTLFPECLEDWICEDNPVRVIDVFVGGLDLAGLRFCGVDPEATGRPSYHPSVLLKLYIYGYLNRVQSSRRLECEACSYVGVMWLARRVVSCHKQVVGFR